MLTFTEGLSASTGVSATFEEVSIGRLSPRHTPGTGVLMGIMRLSLCGGGPVGEIMRRRFTWHGVDICTIIQRAGIDRSIRGRCLHGLIQRAAGGGLCRGYCLRSISPFPDWHIMVWYKLRANWRVMRFGGWQFLRVKNQGDTPWLKRKKHQGRKPQQRRS